MRAWIVAAAVALPGLAAPSAQAQVDVDAAVSRNGHASADVPRLIADLDAADPLVRERASEALTSGMGLTLKDLERALTDEGAPGDPRELSPEQRYRLLSAAFRRFRSPGEPRAAMGVQFDETVREAGVRLQGAVEGFHAHEVLRPGDRVETIAGLRVRDRAHAVAIIVAHDPGDEAELGLVRDGVSLKARVRMGAREALQNAVGLTPDTLNDAWAIRSARYAESAHQAARIIDCGISSAAWPQPPEDPPRNGPAVAAGGEARGAPDPVMIARALEGSGRRPRPNRFQQLRFEGPDVAGQIAGAVQVLRDQAAMVEATIDRNDRLLRDPVLSAPRRAQVHQEQELLRAQLREIQQVILDLQRQAQRPRRR